MSAGLLERMLSGTLRERATSASDERLWATGMSKSAAGVSVTADTALSYDAVFGCVRILAEDTATLPIDVFRRRAGGQGRDEITDHPLAYLFNWQANDYQLAIEFREWMVRIAALYPEAVAEIVPGPRGMVEQLRPLPPVNLTKIATPGGVVQYELREPGKQPRKLGLDEVFRLPSPLGVGVVQLARDEIGTALAANRTAAVMMKNGLTPRMALEHPGQLSTEAQSRLSESISQNVTGPENAGHIPIFEEGMKWVQIGVKPEDAQMLQQMEFSLLQMARWFRMQPHKIAYLLKASYASVEQANLEHVIDTIRPWVTRIEMAARAQLLVLEPDTFIKHNLDALLRGDALSRWQVYEIQRRIGARNANEIRMKEDLNPRPDLNGEAYWDTQPGTGSDPGSKQTPKARQIAESAARRVVEREREALAARAKRVGDDVDGWRAAVGEFYERHAAMVRDALCVSAEAARAYCEEKAAELLAGGPAVAEGWEHRDVPRLATLALGGEE